MDHEFQPLLPLDERFRNAEQYSLDLPPPAPKQSATQVEDDWVKCPYHPHVFVPGCHFCNPR